MTSSDRPLIMSVEDNRDTQQLIERLLGGRGYECIVAENGMKGLQMLLMQNHRPDLIADGTSAIPGADGTSAPYLVKIS